ncbi:hypothetical protein [Hyalangium rubrum]|uniref:Lipoprotein n=1 Tax=Hyalangium rubrum TaxID=3103134 RepID=A0ABU5H0E2_9BACT|nr:hypothetical protein [Hyalangium sp. s54d21]MDY7226771.1 hypothetical protein [Hyalangium sp. s54d21]
MRYLLLTTMVMGCALGCATPGVPPELLQTHLRESQRWQLQYEEEHARAEALAQQLAALEAALEVERLERAEAEQGRQALNEELLRAVVRAEAERQALEEHNAQLRVEQRELTEMHEEMSDVWFESALLRARRHNPAPAPASPAGNASASP